MYDADMAKKPAPTAKRKAAPIASSVTIGRAPVKGVAKKTIRLSTGRILTREQAVDLVERAGVLRRSR
jgi:hypothetical protein